MLNPAASVLRNLLVVAGISVFGVLNAESVHAQQATDSKPAAPVSYYRSVRPILQRNCSGCHFAGKREGGLSVTSVADLLKGGVAGAAMVAGKPDEGTLIGNVSGEDPSMPLNGTPLKAEQVLTLRTWIDRKSTRLNSSH